MLKSLQVNNLALMDHLSIEFREGFSALTGETGAGKSILIESIGFVLGDRSNKDIIRTGEKKASVEALFSVDDDSPAAVYLKECGLYEDEEVVVFRDLNESGRSTARINGTLVSIAELKKLGTMLLDLHGQHAHQSLLNEETHLSIIDACASDEAQVRIMLSARQKTLAARHEREEMEKKLSTRARRLNTIEIELKEINDAALQPDEEEQLTSQRAILRNSSLIEEKLASAYERLYGENGALSNAREASAALSSLTEFAPEFSKYAGQIDDAYYAMEDVSFSVRDAKERLSYNPESLDDIENRLFLIENLMRKYGADISEILSYRDMIERERNNLLQADDIMDALKERERSAFAEFETAAKNLSAIRRNLAVKLSESVESHLKKMGVPNARFHAVFTDVPVMELSENGIDNAVFSFSANRGEDEKSLSRTASGGEISRVMLAIKASIDKTDSIDTLIFDEIDTGISGMIAHSVAEEMQLLSRTHQVLCVTHLPQIAAHAEHQYYIYKEDIEGKTVSRARLLLDEERPSELARIMGGAGEEPAIEHARQLLASSREKYENK